MSSPGPAADIEEIKALTDAAMNGDVRLEEVYERRLDMLQPTREEVAALADRYRENVVTDARELVGALQAAGREVFIVSGGLADAVVPFGAWLGVPEDHIRAVGVQYELPSRGSEVEVQMGAVAPATRAPHRVRSHERKASRWLSASCSGTGSNVPC